MKLRNRVRDEITGAGENAVTVSIEPNNGGAAIATPSTDANGMFELVQNGNPGQVQWSATSQGKTKVIGGDGSAQFDVIYTGELIELLTVLGDGVIYNKGGQLEVTPGAGLEVLVADGVSLLGGFPYVGYSEESVAISPNVSGNPRIDLIVARVYQAPSGADRGKAEIAVIEGTPAVDPSAPAPLAETAGSYRNDIALAELAVPNGAASFTAGSITDRRSYAPGPLLDGSVTFEKIAAADVGMGAGQLAEGDHRHLDDAERNLIVDNESQSAADTSSTTNLSAQGTVAAMTFPLALGVAGSVWTIQAVAALTMKRSVSGQSFLATEIDGTENGINQTLDTNWVRVEHEFARSGIPGNQTVQIRVRYRGTDSGTTSARNPAVRIVAKRTA